MLRKFPCLSLALAVALCCGCESRPAGPASPSGAASPAADRGADTQPAAEGEESAVQVQFKGYQGVQELIKSHEGKVVVMDCWSTWCEPCKKEFHGLVELHEKYGPDKVACVSVCFDYEGLKKEKPEDYKPAVLEFLREQRAAFDNVIANEPSDELYKKFGFPSVPAVFVYDRQGELAKRFENKDAKAAAFTYGDIDAEVASLLE
jgi:thiol-disulfide isomerase/thioredoxin